MPTPAAAEGSTGSVAAPAAASTDAFSSHHLPGNGPTDDGFLNPPREAVAGEAEPEAAAAAEPAAAVEPGAEVDPAAEPAAVADPAKPAKLWAGRYKTPEELEVQYQHSSEEGKRLSVKLKKESEAYEGRIGELTDKLSELEILAEVGPAEAELSDEQLEAMGPVKATRYLQRAQDRKNKLAQIKANQEIRKRETAKATAELQDHIRGSARDMEVDADNFPDFVELKPAMSRLMDIEPGVTGHANSPQVLYLAAYGMRALKRDAEGRKKTAESTKAAAAKSKVAAVGAGAAQAAGGGAKDVATQKKTADPDSDQSYNDRLVAAGQRRNVSF